MENARRCECKYLEVQYKHLTVTVWSNIHLERDGHSAEGILQSEPLREVFSTRIALWIVGFVHFSVLKLSEFKM